MIYNIYFTGLRENRALKVPEYARDEWGNIKVPYRVVRSGEYYKEWRCIQELLREPKNHLFWTYAIGQEEAFKLFMEKYDLNKYIILETPYVVNPNYPDEGPRVKAVIMKGQV